MFLRIISYYSVIFIPHGAYQECTCSRATLILYFQTAYLCEKSPELGDRIQVVSSKLSEILLFGLEPNNRISDNLRGDIKKF